jgi:hypothetical protein
MSFGFKGLNILSMEGLKNDLKLKQSKAFPLSTMQVLAGRGHIAPTRS